MTSFVSTKSTLSAKTAPIVSGTQSHLIYPSKKHTFSKTQSRNVRLTCTANQEKQTPPNVDLAGDEPEPSAETASSKTSSNNLIDPADGSIAYGAALGDSDIVSRSLNVFKTGRASEIINGRVAMVGFTAAMINELFSGNTMFSQVWNVREVVNGYGVREILMPQAGLFLIPTTVLVVMAASLLPQFRGRKDNGLDIPAEPYKFFSPSSEMINGRAAMMGLVALFMVEKLTGSAFF